MADLHICDVRLPDASIGCVQVIDGLITDIAPEVEHADGSPVLNGNGGYLIPGLVDAHAHVDKTTWGLPYRPHSAGPTLLDLTDNERRVRGRLGLTVEDRARALLTECIAQGTTSMRTHVDVDDENGLESVEGVARAVRSLEGQIDVQIVAFPQSGLLRRPGTAELLEKSLSAGADIVGGLDPAGFDRDPVAHLSRVFGIAERHGAPVDIHLHDGGELGAWQLELIAENARARGMSGQVTVSHAFALGDVGVARQHELAEQLADSGVGIATVAPGGHAMIPIKLLSEHGVRVCCGNDGVRDLWGPFGTGSMLERAMLVAYRCGFRRDEDLELCLDIATRGGARVLGIESGYGLAKGDRADFLVARAQSAAEAVSRPERPLLVVKAGRVVARQDGVEATPAARHREESRR
ncbi:amidohydrolase family protein [Streptosporangium sp. NBC_01810]|uniref:amidohydrolase family protein n=1 Tax=Streptosporangium sp. NBC_01810 TaxID=2975951 RepID=UPI002DDC28CC|nr:amidohydrolase family protein [Streptosporangium sp. NBC_01810]WSA28770.1 amidohydrolase family protein [Streptosporangium sp. NBC_01810]